MEVFSGLVQIDFINAPTGCVTNEFTRAFIDLQTYRCYSVALWWLT